jgi:hypothetical protein
MLLLLLNGCLYDYFSGYFHYQAMEYVVDVPRIVGMRSSSMDMVSEARVELDALLLSAPGTSPVTWTVSTCGLGRTVETRAYDLSCFEESGEVQKLASGSMPLSFELPEIPPIEDCGWDAEEQEEQEEDGEGFWDTGKRGDCRHRLPLLFETRVDGIPVYGAAFPDWYSEDPTPAAPDASQWGSAEVTVPLAQRPSAFTVPESASPGDVIEMEYELHADLRYSQFHWYVDAGVLLDTGVTAAVDYESSSSEHPKGITRTRNRWELPPDSEGELRVWVVAQQGWGAPLDMVWREAAVDIR